MKVDATRDPRPLGPIRRADPSTLLEEWAYIRDWHSDRERSDHYEHFVHFYNHHRAHGALGWSTPMPTLKDNVSGHHS